jgi:serine/threonine protein kinase/tetratricopeptide (TPR) repeat protein
MECPHCGLTNSPGITSCTACSTPLPLGDRTVTMTPSVTPSAAVASDRTTDDVSGWSAPGAAGSSSPLEPGRVIGNRYEVLQLLGEGGMGAVYKVRDRELDRLVALKLIRRDLAQNSDVLHRFKQELILARKVTHRNVIRIFDLGDADGVKFITMDYIEGTDLKSLIREKGKFAPKEAKQIIVQVCNALEVAHAEGVIHRDLKPQNIMVDEQGKVSVMDFGIARSMEMGGGMTQTGALVGTPEYMSPEQAKGEKVDARSDLFSLGIIFYELLTGYSPYKADTTMATLWKRTHEAVRPPVALEPGIPRAVSDMVVKCLEIDRERRYQSVTEFARDLEAWEAGTSISAATPTQRWLRGVTPFGKWLAGVAAVLLLVLGLFFREKLTNKSSSGPVTVTTPVTLAILPFRNASGDPALDWLGSSLADMLSTDVGQSPRLRTISPDRLHQVLTDLQVTPNVVIDPTMLRRIAQFGSADTVVWGQYAKFGDQIRIDATLQDLKHDRRVPLRIEVPSEKDIPGGVDRLADSIRQNLGVSGDVVKELQISSFQPTSKSLPALRDYSEGAKLLRDGKNLDAQKVLEAATKEDPTFALAFSKLAQTYANLGYDGQAEQAAQKAVGLGENLPQAERYLIAAIHAQITRNYPDAIKAYENLAKASPDNADVQSALARLYEDTGDFAKADEYYQKILTGNPKDIAAIVSTGRVAIKRGDTQDSLDPLNRALSLSIQLGNDEERSTSLHLIGVAYKRLNKPEYALRNFQEALAIRRKTGDKRAIAFSVNEMATVEESLGKAKDALIHYQEALQIRREIGDKRGLGDTLMDLGGFYDDRGDHDQALKMYKEALQLERDIGDEGLQAACLNNIGSAYFFKNEYEDARTYFQQALQLREKSKMPQDVVESVHNLAETSARMGQYDQAITQYMRALDLRRSMDDSRGGAIEAYSLGTLFDYQGRFGAAINSKQEALKTFRDLKDRTFWMAEILGGYAQALTLAGRGQESQPYLEDALNLSHELKNDGLVAQTLAFQGDVSYFRGDTKSARSYYQGALQAAARSKEPDKMLVAKTALGRADVEGGHPAVAISDLRSVVGQAEEQGFAYVAVECSIYMAAAMIRTHDDSHARQELERALVRADKLGLKPLSAKAHYLLATSQRASGNQVEAQDHYRSAIQLLNAMRMEAGSEKILQRSDFKSIYDEANRLADLGKN